MFDLGFWELLVVGVVALIVVGPNDLPKLFRNVGNFMGRARAMGREFTRAMEDAADDTGLKGAAEDLQKLNRMKGLDVKAEARNFTRQTVMGGAPSEPKSKPEVAADTAPNTAPKTATESAGAKSE